MGIDEGSRVETPEAQMNKQPRLLEEKLLTL
jgi:hypothetical protein